MFTTHPLLMAAKTAVKEVAKKKPTVVTKKVEKVKSNVRDPSKPPQSQAFSLTQLIERLPKPENPEDKSTWHHKNGWGLKFYRKAWAKYPEPSYWTVTKYKPSTHNHTPKVWGVLTWRGHTESEPREIAGQRKREWKLLVEDPSIKLNITPIRPASASKDSSSSSLSTSTSSSASASASS